MLILIQWEEGTLGATKESLALETPYLFLRSSSLLDRTRIRFPLYFSHSPLPLSISLYHSLNLLARNNLSNIYVESLYPVEKRNGSSKS